MKLLLAAILGLSLLACTDATVSKLKAYGLPGHITCYSGGKLVYEGDSTGAIASEAQSDGWLLREAGTNTLIRVSGDCIIRSKQ